MSTGCIAGPIVHWHKKNNKHYYLHIKLLTIDYFFKEKQSKRKEIFTDLQSTSNTAALSTQKNRNSRICYCFSNLTSF